MNYTTEFNRLVKKAKQQGLSVVLVDKGVLHDFIGMNSHTAKVFGLPMPNKTIYIANCITPYDMLHTLNHELDEYYNIPRNHWKYWPAHLHALQQE